MHNAHFCAKNRVNVTYNLEILTLKEKKIYGRKAIYDLTILPPWDKKPPSPLIRKNPIRH